ncbi:MAG: sensor hybrid histidine kinase [Gammaproteobacteria bacterium]|nr:sensor hybrid histidine kinase [Gammaproteobacteria bacterium]
MANPDETAEQSLIGASVSPHGSLTSDEADRARALLAAIVMSSEDAIVSKTLDGIVTAWNNAAERLFGFSAAEMIGESITRIIPKELQHEEVAILAKLRAGERIERYETVRMHKDGQKLDISLTVSPIRDSAGTIVGAAKMAHDITARRRAERELLEREAQLSKLSAERESILESERAARSEAERLGRMKDEFLATLSHELRTPLHAIQGWATLLRERRAKPEDFDRGLETIERNVRIQVQIVNDLLDMSRIISGKIHLEVQPLYLHDIVSHSLDAVRQSALAKEIRIQPLLDTRIGLVRGDPSRLQQVLWNLLSNAIKFTPKAGRVQVVLERVNSHAEISVEDTGIGIRPEFLPHVFDRFRQADPSTTRQHGGLGLGLSIVKNLVELHGGTVRVKSSGENQGTTFIVALPISHVRADERYPSHPQAAAPNPLDLMELPTLSNVRILVVDDESDGRAFIARILEDRGASVTCASSGQEALEALSRNHFDLLLSDIGMPDMDGFELIRRVRALDKSRTGPIPVMAITAYARAEDRQRSLLAGFHMHLAKPIEARELIASIAGLIHLSQ